MSGGQPDGQADAACTVGRRDKRHEELKAPKKARAFRRDLGDMTEERSRAPSQGLGVPLHRLGFIFLATGRGERWEGLKQVCNLEERTLAAGKGWLRGQGLGMQGEIQEANLPTLWKKYLPSVRMDWC